MKKILLNAYAVSPGMGMGSETMEMCLAGASMVWGWEGLKPFCFTP